MIRREGLDPSYVPAIYRIAELCDEIRQIYRERKFKESERKRKEREWRNRG